MIMVAVSRLESKVPVFGCCNGLGRPLKFVRSVGRAHGGSECRD